MSAETRPISPASFAKALEDLPIENIYSKVHEINNSIAHLKNSNKLLQEYSDSTKNDESLDAETRADGDKDSLDAIRENTVVVERQQDRVRLLKAEVERRGQRWHEIDPDESKHAINGNSEVPANGDDNGNAGSTFTGIITTFLNDDRKSRFAACRLTFDMKNASLEASWSICSFSQWLTSASDFERNTDISSSR